MGNNALSSSAIGIDIGGTFTKIGVVERGGRVSQIERIRTCTSGDPSVYLDSLRKSITARLTGDLAGIGFSLPGLLADDMRSIRFNPNTPALVGIDFVSLFSDFGLPLAIDADLNTPALAEYAFGSGQGAKRFMTAVIGTGAGSGMILNGQVLRFNSGFAGDTGHVILQPDGPQCTAGCKGCAEAMVTIAAIEREARKAGFSSLDAERGRLAQAVIQAARQGEPVAAGIMTEIGRRVGQWLASLAPIFLPDRMAVCGGVAEAGAVLLEACQARFYDLAGEEYARCEITLGTFQELAGLIGATVPLFG